MFRTSCQESVVHIRFPSINVGQVPHRARLSRGLLGGHIAGGAQHLPGSGEIRVALGQFGQAEVGDSRISVPVEQDIPWLLIAVDDSFFMRVLHCLAMVLISWAASRAGRGPFAIRAERLCPSTNPIEK